MVSISSISSKDPKSPLILWQIGSIRDLYYHSGNHLSDISLRGLKILTEVLEKHYDKDQSHNLSGIYHPIVSTYDSTYTFKKNSGGKNRPCFNHVYSTKGIAKFR